MKKLLILVACLLMITSAASAERTVVTALAAEINPDSLVSVAFDAKINSYTEGIFSITILVPERYDPEEIQALQVGDAIFTEGREVEIKNLSKGIGSMILNAGTADEVFLFESIDCNYWITNGSDNTWLELATVTVPASDHLIFLDSSTEETILHPTVYNAAGFVERMNAADDSGFDIHNVEVVIDEEGKVAVIRRFYVSWQ